MARVKFIARSKTMATTGRRDPSYRPGQISGRKQYTTKRCSQGIPRARRGTIPVRIRHRTQEAFNRHIRSKLDTSYFRERKINYALANANRALIQANRQQAMAGMLMRGDNRVFPLLDLGLSGSTGIDVPPNVARQYFNNQRTGRQYRNQYNVM